MTFFLFVCFLILFSSFFHLSFSRFFIRLTLYLSHFCIIILFVLSFFLVYLYLNKNKNKLKGLHITTTYMWKWVLQPNTVLLSVMGYCLVFFVIVRILSVRWSGFIEQVIWGGSGCGSLLQVWSWVNLQWFQQRLKLWRADSSDGAAQGVGILQPAGSHLSPERHTEVHFTCMTSHACLSEFNLLSDLGFLQLLNNQTS